MRVPIAAFLLTTVLIGQAAGAEWVKGGTDSKERVLFENNTLKISDNSVKVWLDHVATKQVAGHSVAGYREFVEIDCNNNHYRSINASYYDRSGKEFVKTLSPEEKSWKRTTPSSVMSTTVRKICSKIKADKK